MPLFPKSPKSVLQILSVAQSSKINDLSTPELIKIRDNYIFQLQKRRPPRHSNLLSSPSRRPWVYYEKLRLVETLIQYRIHGDELTKYDYSKIQPTVMNCAPPAPIRRRRKRKTNVVRVKKKR